ncbi:MAG: hypothetical protein Q9M36_08920 [Sulfurovum sp.]|nr:hypothetical protein [Sulfurovum sp.]
MLLKVNKTHYSYIITSGWWSIEEEKDDRLIKCGDAHIRSSSFHQLWTKAIDKYTLAKKVYIIDSNAPIKPKIDSQNEVLFSLLENAGHSTNHSGKLCGVSRAHLLGMSLALVNEVEYWVYIEQDALIYGDGIIEECIKKMKKPYMFGNGWGTPQPTQQSFMIIKSDAIASFIQKFSAIKATDNEISPETKFAIATSRFLGLLPEFLFKNIHTKSIKNRILWRLFTVFQGFDSIPFGYGRVRPIDFSDEYFYFQHGSKTELDKYILIS